MLAAHAALVSLGALLVVVAIVLARPHGTGPALAAVAGVAIAVRTFIRVGALVTLPSFTVSLVVLWLVS